MSEWISIFTFAFPQKILKITIIYYGFVLIFASCSVYYLFRWFYKSKAKVLIEDFKNNAAGIFYVTVEFGLKNIFFGSVHFLGRSFPYFALISILLTGELTILLLMIFFGSKSSKCLCKMWLGVALTLLRMSFIVTLIFDYQNSNIQIEDCQFILIVLMISIFVLGIVVGFKEFFLEYILFFYKKCCKTNKVFEKNSKNKQQT